MRHISRSTLRSGVVVAVIATVAAILWGGAGEAQGAPERPNVIVIQTDDQVYADVDASMRDSSGRVVPVMPATRHLIGGRGVEFERYYVTFPICCPSRVSLLTGRYAHTSGVLGNNPPDGGWTGFRRSAGYRHNLATWLRRAGYRTIHIGKFLNHYGSEERYETIVPPGWAEWQTDASERSARKFYGYRLNVNGRIQGPFGDPEYGLLTNVDPPGCFWAPVSDPDCNHKTDAITRRAVEQIEVSTRIGRPFYLQLDYNAPHGDHQPPIGPEPTPRNYGRADGTPPPRSPAYDLGRRDKPSFVRNLPPLSDLEHRRIAIDYRKTLESLLDVDQGVRRILATLARTGQLGRTYVIFTSDNGFFRGEHRIERGKLLPYEPAVRLPLLIRGPGIKPGTVSSELVANIDIAPTVLQLTSTRATATIDGRSLVRFWRDPSARTRRPIRLESFSRRSPEAPPLIRNYHGAIQWPYKHIVYDTGERELYHLERDPHELRNLARVPRFLPVRRHMERQSRRLARCQGASCRRPAVPLP